MWPILIQFALNSGKKSATQSARITVESKVGEGSTFTITLPIQKQTANVRKVRELH